MVLPVDAGIGYHHEVVLGGVNAGVFAKTINDFIIKTESTRRALPAHRKPELWMDNVRLHQAALTKVGLQKALDDAGIRVRFLPPYSPFLHAIGETCARREQDVLVAHAARTQRSSSGTRSEGPGPSSGSAPRRPRCSAWPRCQGWR
jgi:hypothetical protein